jgi:tRNA A37 threonylcarbamoyladenosine dehydratase
MAMLRGYRTAEPTWSQYMNDEFQRLRLMVGDHGLAALRAARVTVFGVGGVGSHAVEALVRAAVGHLTLVDFDDVAMSNINRQIEATHSTVGQPKAETMAARVRDICPTCDVVAIGARVTPENVESYLDPEPDWVLDAIDDTEAKLALLATCVRRGIRVVSGMGAANKLLPGSIRTEDISRSRQCPLAKVIRKRLRRQGIERGITVVYSEELPVKLADGTFQAPEPEVAGMKRPQGTISYLPALVGLNCAAAILRGLLADVPFQRRGETPPKRRDSTPLR